MMRTVVMDPQGNVLNPDMVPVGTALPVASYVTRTHEGEIVGVVMIDPTRAPQTIWNPAMLIQP